MPELRENPITKEWVIIATERSKRPTDFAVKHDLHKGGNCPFCPGNESQTPPEITAFRQPESKPDQPGWWIRVVPNKFAALGNGSAAPVGDGNFYHVIPGDGAHEVVIESVEHDITLAEQSLQQMTEIVRMWRDRYNFLIEEEGIKYVQLFKNKGAVAGASLGHPHSQIIATPIIPPLIDRELKGAESAFVAKDRCPYCDIIEHELQEGSRLVAQNQDFIAFCPFASRFPFEHWILPREHHASFGSLSEGKVSSLVRIIQETSQATSQALDSPPFNMVLHSAPAGYAESPFYHWHLEFLPRLTVVAGFEWGSGLFINPTPPETAAGYLRESKDSPMQRSESH